MKNTQRLLDDILKLKKDFAATAMKLPPGLAGIYGELLSYQTLKRKLEPRNFKVRLFAGQKGADIQAVKDGKMHDIEVKTSRLKDEGYGLWYGAALNIKKCKIKKHAKRFLQHPTRGRVFGDFCYFDHLIFVALDESFGKPRFYVIPREFIEANEKLLRNTHRRFSSATHRILISNGKMPRMSNEQKKLIRQTEKFLNRWDILS